MKAPILPAPTLLDLDAQEVRADAREAPDLFELLTLLGVACGPPRPIEDAPGLVALPLTRAPDAAEARRIGELVASYNTMRKSRAGHEARRPSPAIEPPGPD